MDKGISPLGQAIIRTARDYNRFVDSGQNKSERSCRNCIRKQFSFPWTCNEGWDLMRARRSGQGGRCANWTDTSKNCRVDGLSKEKEEMKK